MGNGQFCLGRSSEVLLGDQKGECIEGMLERMVSAEAGTGGRVCVFGKKHTVCLDLGVWVCGPWGKAVKV